VDWLAPTEASARASRAFEFLFRLHGLERDPPVRAPHEALGAAAELAGLPTPFVRVGQQQGDDFEAAVHSPNPASPYGERKQAIRVPNAGAQQKQAVTAQQRALHHSGDATKFATLWRIAAAA